MREIPRCAVMFSPSGALFVPHTTTFAQTEEVEQTPFDPFPDSPADEEIPPAPAPPVTTTSFDDFSGSIPPSTPPPISAAPTIRVDEPLPSPPVPSTPMQRKPNPALWAIPLALVLLGASGVGISLYRKQQQVAAREQKLSALRAQLKKIVLQDNALVMEVLDEDALEHITYGEFFKRAGKNKEARDELVRELRATESGPYGEAVAHYIELLETENKWVRAEEAVSNASLDASTKWDSYQRALKQTEKVSGQVESSYQAFLAAPYGSDFSQRMDFKMARSNLENASEASRASFAQWSEAQSAWNDKKRAAALVITQWLRDEPEKYLKFAPKRDVAALLNARKTSYAGASSTSKSGSNDAAQITPIDNDDTNTSTTPIPEPAVPTRVRAGKPLDGERFPQTRMQDIDEEYASNLSDEDVRYAINEMFARYGMTFRDKSLQSQFEQTTWYRPDEKWTMPQIKSAFSQRERDNLDILTRERDSRRDGGVESGDEDAGSSDDNVNSDEGEEQQTVESRE